MKFKGGAAKAKKKKKKRGPPDQLSLSDGFTASKDEAVLLMQKVNKNETEEERDARTMKQKLDESIQLKFITQHKNLEEHPTTNYDTLHKTTLICSRNIGNREEMPGAG